MPKMKTKRAAAKRFHVTGSGKIARRRAYKRHILTKMSTKRKRHLRPAVTLCKGDEKVAAPLLPYRSKM